MRYVLIADDSTELPAIDVLHRLQDAGHEAVLVVQMSGTRAPVAQRRRELWERMRSEQVAQRQAHVAIQAELQIRGIEARSLFSACDDLGLKWWRASAVDDLLQLEIQERDAEIILSLCPDIDMAALAPAATEGVVAIGPGLGGQLGAPDAISWSLFTGQPPAIRVVHQPAWDEADAFTRSESFPVSLPEQRSLERIQRKVELELVRIACATLDRLPDAATAEALPPMPLKPPLGHMAQPLCEVLDVWLQNGTTPQASFSQADRQ